MATSTDYSTLKSNVIQVAVSIVASWGMVHGGMVLGFPSAMLPPLLGLGPGLHTTFDQASWLASSSFISASVACLLAGPLIDRLGRRKGLLLLNFTFLSGWLIIAVFSQSLYALYLGRLLTGLGLGTATCVIITYTAEVTTVTLRTAVVTLPSIMISVGTFIVYLWALLYQDSSTEVSYFGFGITMLSVLLTPLLPESPLWLLNTGRTKEATQVLLRLRGASAPEQVKDELETMSSRAKAKRDMNSWRDTLNNMRQPQAYKPLIIMNIYFLFVHTSGMVVVTVFAVDFIKDAGIEAQAYYIALCIASLRLFSNFFTSWACIRYGRRCPTMWSGTVTCISILSLTFTLFLGVSPWISGILILIYVFSCVMVFSTLPWSIMGEIFPTSVRGVASGITSCNYYFGSFIAVKLYPIMVVLFGSFPVFLFFGISGLVGTLFLYLFLPETHGKTLLEIEDYFKGDKEQFITQQPLCLEID